MSNIRAMNRQDRKSAERYLKKENAKWPERLTPIPKEAWPKELSGLIQVFRSRGFLVQIYGSQWGGTLRMSVNRTALTHQGNWDADITWEELQRLKAEAGYGDMDAVEVYPSDRDVVNVANMRHLWILQDPLPFAWRA